MLRDYFWSFSAVVVLLGTYTALMLGNKHMSEVRSDSARTSMTIKAKLDTHEASGGPAAVDDIKISD